MSLTVTELRARAMRDQAARLASIRVPARPEVGPIRLRSVSLTEAMRLYAWVDNWRADLPEHARRELAERMANMLERLDPNDLAHLQTTESANRRLMEWTEAV